MLERIDYPDDDATNVFNKSDTLQEQHDVQGLHEEKGIRVRYAL